MKKSNKGNSFAKPGEGIVVNAGENRHVTRFTTDEELVLFFAGLDEDTEHMSAEVFMKFISDQLAARKLGPVPFHSPRAFVSHFAQHGIFEKTVLN